jgi:F-type H+-transporting ATPase subunit epsilon
MSTMQVEVVTPERVIYSGEATMVVTRTLSGEIAFLPNHAPFLGALVENHTRIYVTDDQVEHVAVQGGFVEVSDNRVSILSDQAELADEIDVERARQDAELAQAMLAREEVEEGEVLLRRATARLSAAGAT